MPREDLTPCTVLITTTGPNAEVYICWWGPDGLMFDRSLDQGLTWLTEDINITNHVNWIYTIPGD